MAAETNVITSSQMARAREIDFANKFTHNSLEKLIEALGVTRKVELMEGTTLYVYKTTGTLQSGAVAEGDIIPLSEYETAKTPVGTITLNKWRKAVTAEAIAKSGYDAAVNETDAKLLRDVQSGIRADMFTFLNGTIADSTAVAGNSLQSALANAWAQLQIKFEDDSVDPVYFVNPLDIADYLATANVTTQNAFGMNYIKDFLGLGTVVMTSPVTAGTFVATAKENIIMYYMSMSGDVANAFGLTTDDLGYVGIKSGYATNERAQIESLVMNGVQFLVEYAEGVVKGTITVAVSNSETFTGTGTKKTFELTYSPVSITSVTVGDTATTAYTVVGKKITFASAPANNAAIVVTYTHVAPAE